MQSGEKKFNFKEMRSQFRSCRFRFGETLMNLHRKDSLSDYILFFMCESCLGLYFIRHKKNNLQAGFSELKHLDKNIDAKRYKFVLKSVKGIFPL